MTKYTNKLIRLNRKYPVWNNERDEIDGYTDENDMAAADMIMLNSPSEKQGEKYE